jgi:CheY-like chemotaxis protein
MNPIRILAVDDNSSALYATSRVLRSAGYEVIEASTGAAALAAAPQADLVVLDVNLPDIDGFEVCRRLRANPETALLPVLHLSATFTNSSDFTQGFEAGADSYLDPAGGAAGFDRDRAHIAVRASGGHDQARTGCEAAHDVQSGAGGDRDPGSGVQIRERQSRLLRIDRIYRRGIDRSARRHGAECDPPEGAGTTRSHNSRQAANGRSSSPSARKMAVLRKVEWQIATEKISSVSILTATDITRQVQAESAREHCWKASGRRAPRLNAAIDEGRVSCHPVARVAQSAERHPRMGDGAEPQAGLVGFNAGRPQGDRAQFENPAQMIADLLDHAGITFGKMRLVAETIDPYPIVRAALMW